MSEQGRDGEVFDFCIEQRIKWFCRASLTVGIEKYIDWQVSITEEDGGAYKTNRHKGKTLNEAMEKAWRGANMDNRVKGMMVYRDVNFKDESDEDLGIVVTAMLKAGEGKA